VSDTTDPQAPSDAIGPALARELAALLTPLTDAAASDTAAGNVLAAIGWQASALPFTVADFRTALNGFVQVATALEAYTDMDPGDDSAVLGVITSILQATQALPQAVTGLSNLVSSNSVTGLGNLAGDLTIWLFDNYLKTRHPVWRAVMGLVTLWTPQELAAQQPAVADGSGNVLRAPYQLPALHFDQLSVVLSNPKQLLKNTYLPSGALDTPAAVQTFAGGLFPLVAAALEGIGFGTQSGIPAYYELGIDPDDAAVLTNALTFWFSDSGPAIDEGNVAGITFAIYPPDASTNNQAGFVISPILTALDGGSASWSISLAVGNPGAPFSVVGWQASPADATSWPGLDLTLTLQFGADPPQAGAPGLARPGVQGKIELSVSAANSLTAKFSIGGYAGLSFGSKDLPDNFLTDILPADAIQLNLQVTLTADASGVSIASGTANGASFKFAAGSSVALGPVVLDNLTIGVDASATNFVVGGYTDIDVSIGPIAATVVALGVGLTATWPAGGGNAGPLNVQAGVLGPTSVSFLLDAGIVSGGGMLFYAPAQGQYGGALQLGLDVLSLAAIGLVSTRFSDGTPITNSDGTPGYSLLIIITATFPPIQLGFGFALTGLGGLLGLNRTMNVDALRAGVRNRALDSALMPTDPLDNAAQLVTNLSNLFPVAMGRFLVGPMAEISWGDPPLIVFDLAILIELPAPLVIALLGRIRVALPQDDDSAVVLIHLDVLGILDFGQGTVSIDASIYDSIVADFTLSGDMALRAGWKNNAQFLLSLGGFHPSFQPPPAFPRLQLLTIDLCSGDNPRVGLHSYFALTSNTVQCGASADLHASAGGFDVDGSLLFDTLVTFNPFGLEVDIAVSMSVAYDGAVIFSISASLHIVGPGPWQIAGRASVSFLCFSATVRFDATFGQATPAPLPAPVDVSALLAAAFSTSSNWSAQPPAGDAVVAIRSAPPDGNVRGHPFATLTFRQRTAPLGIALDCFGSAPISGANEFTLGSVSLGPVAASAGPVTDAFAPGQFLNLTADQKLSRPSFEALQSGFTVVFDASDEDSDSTSDAQALNYEVILVDSASTAAAPSAAIDAATSLRLASSGAAAAAPSGRSAGRRFGGAPLGVRIAPRSFAVTDAADTGAPPLATTDSWTAAEQARARLQESTSANLQVVRT
jgi:hypothetical protein